MNQGVDWLLGVLGVSLLLVLVRLGRGSSLADRVLALDLITVIGLSALAVFSLKYEEPAFLDVAILLGLVGFIGSVAFARAMELAQPPANRNPHVGESPRSGDPMQREKAP
jgi:multicomponent Na+:H+ antiporter subunit F